MSGSGTTAFSSTSRGTRPPSDGTRSLGLLGRRFGEGRSRPPAQTHGPTPVRTVCERLIRSQWLCRLPARTVRAMSPGLAGVAGAGAGLLLLTSAGLVSYLLALRLTPESALSV